MTTEYGLIADIGGTNARFALVPRLAIADTELGMLDLDFDDLVAAQTLKGTDYPHIRDAIEAYLASVADEYGRPRRGCLAIASSTHGDYIRMTNHTWAFSLSELKQALDFDSLLFINDYHAQANAIPYLKGDELYQVGGGEAEKGLPMAVTGPGTGLGLAALAFGASGPVTLETEGGHAHFAATDAVEMKIVEFLLNEMPRVSSERLLSGMGLENIYRALCAIAGESPQSITAPDISQAAVDGSDPRCREALERFCAVLGSYAGDVALTIGARGGVYIAGGIVPRFIDFFEASQFRRRFEDKARFEHYTSAIPTWVVMAREPGLLGTAAVINYYWQD